MSTRAEFTPQPRRAKRYPKLLRVYWSVQINNRGATRHHHVYCRGCSRLIARDILDHNLAMTTALVHSNVHTK